MKITLSVNGDAATVETEPAAPLMDVLRDQLGYLSPKPGCREGRCGACTVLLDDAPVLSCLLPVARAADGRVTTLEGLSRDGELHPVQRAFAAAGAIQCGICTPGMIMAVAALLEENRSPSDGEIRRALVNNLCRCTGYGKILEAVRSLVARGGS